MDRNRKWFGSVATFGGSCSAQVGNCCCPPEQMGYLQTNALARRVQLLKQRPKGYSCPRAARFSAISNFIIQDTPWNPLDHHRTLVFGGLRGCHNWAAIVPRDASLSDSGCNFFLFGIQRVHKSKRASVRKIQPKTFSITSYRWNLAGVNTASLQRGSGYVCFRSSLLDNRVKVGKRSCSRVMLRGTGKCGWNSAYESPRC